MYRLGLVVFGMFFIMNIWGLMSFGILRLVEIRAGLVPKPELDRLLSFVVLHTVPATVMGIVSVGKGWALRPFPLVCTGVLFTLWLLGLRGLGYYRTHPPWNPALSGAIVATAQFAMARLDLGLSREAAPPDPVVTVPQWEPPEV